MKKKFRLGPRTAFKESGERRDANWLSGTCSSFPEMRKESAGLGWNVKNTLYDRRDR